MNPDVSRKGGKPADLTSALPEADGRRSPRPGAGSAGESLHRLFDPAPVAVAAVDARSLTIAYTNPAMREISGLAPDEAVGHPLSDAIPRQVADQVAVLVSQMGRTGERPTHVKIRHVHAEGDDRCLSVSAWSLADGGDAAPLVMLQLEDVSDEMRERELRQTLVQQMRDVNEHLLVAALREQELTLRAEAANDAKSAFLAMMSHELRTPLTAIIGYEELLSDGISGPVSEEQVAQLGRIRHSAMHLLALVEQVLTLTRIELQGETVERERFTLSQLIRSVAVLVAPLASEKRLAFRTELSDEDLVIESDPLRLKQALVNLCGNAVRFTDHGEVLLRVSEEPDDVLAFEVCDTGIGIAAEDQERIFDPFWQVEQRATRRVGGAGLGLTVAQRTARLLGGDVTVRSVRGEGSVFTLRIPRLSAALPDESPVESPVESPGRLPDAG